VRLSRGSTVVRRVRLPCVGGGEGAELVVAEVQRRETRFLITQVTSSTASSTFESSGASRASIHHPRDTTTRKSPSFPPSARSPQSPSPASSSANGHSLVSRHSGWAADHHATHFSSKFSKFSMGGTSFLANRRPYLNHRATSSGRGLVGSFEEP